MMDVVPRFAPTTVREQQRYTREVPEAATVVAAVETMAAVGVAAEVPLTCACWH
jgi:hypothetical protein